MQIAYVLWFVLRKRLIESRAMVTYRFLSELFNIVGVVNFYVGAYTCIAYHLRKRARHLQWRLTNRRVLLIFNTLCAIWYRIVFRINILVMIVKKYITIRWKSDMKRSCLLLVDCNVRKSEKRIFFSVGYHPLRVYIEFTLFFRGVGFCNVYCTEKELFRIAIERSKRAFVRPR